jgi:hypothetical protein
MVSDNNYSPVKGKKDRSKTLVGLKTLYGEGIYKNSQNKEFGFLQENLGDLDDPLLKKMPLLKRLTKENLIPIIDFEDRSQLQLNYLLIHGFSRLPNV